MSTSRIVSVESTTSLDFVNLVRKVKRDIRTKFPDDSEEQYNKRIYDSLKTLKINEQTFEYESEHIHLGGVRWYVLCPQCGKRCLKLYLPNKFPGKVQKFLCVACHGLKHASLLVGSTAKYKEVIKPLKRLEKLRGMLLKSNMTSEKALPYLEEYEKIEKNLSNSPAYKLWKFKLEHDKNMRDPMIQPTLTISEQSKEQKMPVPTIESGVKNVT
jgi:hypothetical protein